MNVLSVFDGISCGRIALERAGINVKNYFASEIDKYTIQKGSLFQGSSFPPNTLTGSLGLA